MPIRRGELVRVVSLFWQSPCVKRQKIDGRAFVAESQRLIWMRFANPDTSTRYVAGDVRRRVWCFGDKGIWGFRDLGTRFLNTARCLLPAACRRLAAAFRGASRRTLRVCLLPAVCCLLPTAYCWAVPWHEDFEGAAPSWSQAGVDIAGAVKEHARITKEAFAGRQCEWLRVVSRGAAAVYVSHNVGRARVIPELAASVWVKSDRPGLQLFARVVLPRTNDPRSQTPLLLRLEGTIYTQPGRWQQLRVEKLNALLLRRIQGLRLQIGPQVDGREAYVDQLLLNVHGG
ncbi:MAG TPA: hypothetical protein VJL29_05740, partial [Thermoguttaceae bacterium]|nr:hypothetical protein [Thermoguttaceae bacterium]